MNQVNKSVNIYEFIKTIQELKQVLRATFATSKRKENSAEHSWSVAMIIWFLSIDLKKEFGQEIDLNRMIKMGLAHDLIELQIGDTSVWDKENRLQSEVEEKRKDIFLSLVKCLQIELRNELIELKNEFDQSKTIESKIVKGVDRLSAALQRVVTKQGWVNEGHSEQDLDEIQLPKIIFSEVLKSFYNQIKQDSFEQGLLER